MWLRVTRSRWPWPPLWRSAVNYRGVTRTAVLTRILLVVVLAVLAAVVVVGLPKAHWQPVTWNNGVLQAAGLLFFAFAEYARIATMGEEVRDPSRTIPRAILI